VTTAALLFVSLAFFASLVSAVFGLGTALLVIGLGAHLLPAQDTIVLATVLFTASTVSKTLIYRHQIDWQLALLVAVASFPFAFAGAFFLPFLAPNVLRVLLGAMILIYLIVKYQTHWLPDFSRLRHHTPGLVVVAATYGFCSGLLGSGNVIKAIVFRELKLYGPGFVGVMAATSVLSNIAKLSAFTAVGLLQKHPPTLILALCVVAIGAVVLGRWVLPHLDANRYHYGVDIILALSAVALFF